MRDSGDGETTIRSLTKAVTHSTSPIRAAAGGLAKRLRRMERDVRGTCPQNSCTRASVARCRATGLAADPPAPGRAASRARKARFLARTREKSRPLRCAFTVRCTSSALIGALVQRRDLLDPRAAVAMLEIHDLVVRPVEVIGDEGYLLVS